MHFCPEWPSKALDKAQIPVVLLTSVVWKYIVSCGNLQMRMAFRLTIERAFYMPPLEDLVDVLYRWRNPQN